MKFTTKYRQEFTQWLNSETEMQRLGLSDTFEWQWFVTMTSKDTMTKNGARLAMTRFLGQYLLESQTEEIQCFWVAEPHGQGKEGYHMHALLQTKWPVPKERRRELNLALMLDDIYQRAMGVYVESVDFNGKTKYTDRFGRETNKHRFRAEAYAKTRGEYCAKYITKEEDVLWEFARVTLTEVERTAKPQDFLWESAQAEDKVDAKGNFCKKTAREYTRNLKHSLNLAMGEKTIKLKNAVSLSEQNYISYSKLRATKTSLEVECTLKSNRGNIFY